MNEARPKSRAFLFGGIILLIVACAAYLYLSISKGHATHDDATEREKDASAGARIRIAQVTPASPERMINLPGEVRPYASVTLYAKISGYVGKIVVDRGDDVKDGQIIATIESPELDKQYSALEVDAKNKRSIAKRNQDLLAKSLIAPQDAEQSLANAEAAEALLAAASQQRSYQTLRSPLSGKVTSRFVDRGAFVQGGSNSAPIVTLSELNRVRIYIYLNQKDAVSIHAGDSVTVIIPERPDKKISATITRYTGEIDQKTRTLLAEIDLDNKDNAILPGSFVRVTIKMKAREYAQIPSEGLIIRKGEYFVALVDSGQVLHFQKIELADNDGKVIQIASGLVPGQTIGLGIGNSYTEGEKVQVIAPPNPSRK
ncbi:MAG: efflux RND transporter periplasmic adaptor subunit [bacterium]